MTPSLSSKIAVVTGAAQGLGAAICERLRQEGAAVVPADVKGLGTSVDVTKEVDVARLFDQTVQRHGRVDLVVANAGILIAEPIAEADAEKWGHLLDCLLRYIDDQHSILDIALKHDLPFGRLRRYLERFEEKGLIRLHFAEMPRPRPLQV